ncbi:hypothetical protein JF541_15580 [Marinobacter hydrocarbonoclasticus]|uniref:hypothetical protein n=1 Tax=Marinobacter nauticus TaxID=2743 RepID=UPI001A8EB359|nr:hypothetical protein [Marinobacter nauticus]MBN8240581.1 hypothetical protein [Marinobacter nauticus]
MARDSSSNGASLSCERVAYVRYRYLCSIAERQIIPDEIVEICKRQSRLAAWSVPNQRIRPVSLNTLKIAADREIEEGGWARLDALRRSISRHLVNRPVSKSDAQKAEINRLRNQLEEAARARAILNRAYFDALNLLQAAAVRDEMLRAQLERHDATFKDLLGLRVVSGGKDGE